MANLLLIVSLSYAVANGLRPIKDFEAQTAAPATAKVCTDKIGYEKCRLYGKQACINEYKQWALDNCEKYCGYCEDKGATERPCVDYLPNCEDYDPKICSNQDYRIWVEDHCCSFCQGNRPSKAPITQSPNCNNQIDCDIYTDSACVGVYSSWAYQNCPLRCGYCVNKTEPCFDKINYCDKYAADVCDNDSYLTWARRNCRKYCNKCYTKVNVLGSGSHQVVTPKPFGKTTSGNTGSITTPGYILPTPPPGPGVTIGTQNTYLVEGPPAKNPDHCLYEGNSYKLNERWYDGCQYICECFDTVRNRMICTDRCSNWNSGEIESCKLVQEPGECCRKLECYAQ